MILFVLVIYFIGVQLQSLVQQKPTTSKSWCIFFLKKSNGKSESFHDFSF